MLNGDISNRVEPRIVVAWEHLLAELDPALAAREGRYCRHRQWKKAVSLWEDNDLGWRAVSHLSYVKCMPVDILITKPEPFADYIRQRLDDRPYGRIYVVPTHEDFEYRLTSMPEVGVVYHGETGRPFLYGSKGAAVVQLSNTI